MIDCAHTSVGDLRPVEKVQLLIESNPNDPFLIAACSLCGARFGIGYHGACNNDPQATDETEELPRKLMEILAKDHRQNRAHKCFIELGV